MQKLEAEMTAKRVSGVVAVANAIEVRLPIFTIKDQIPRSPATRSPRFRTGYPTPRTTFASCKGRLGYAGRFGRVELQVERVA